MSLRNILVPVLVVVTLSALFAKIRRYTEQQYNTEQQYSDITSAALMRDVKQLASIAHGPASDTYWGRISGTDADHQTERWIKDQFEKLHLEQVRIQDFPLPAQWYPGSWTVAAVSGGGSVTLRSAQPVLQSPGIEQETAYSAIYLGLGSALEFRERDVRGKAVILTTIPVGSVLRHSAVSNGAVERAAQAGAAAILLIMDLPGNPRVQLEGGGGPPPKMPTFSLGKEDGDRLLKLMELSAVRLQIHLHVRYREGLSTGNVWGVLPGATSSNVLIIAHHDSYFEGADDNATGVATLLAVARHFAELPLAKRRHTMVFVATPAHHAGMVGVQWLRDNFDFSNTSLIINCEHTASVQTYLLPVINKMNGPQAGAVLMKSNVTAPRMWYISGTPQLHELIMKTLREFGVGILDEPEPVALGELSAVYNKAPSFQLVEAPIFYHTDLDRPDMVSPTGLEAVAKAYAAIVDKVD
jgi:hypothetical protein